MIRQGAEQGLEVVVLSVGEEAGVAVVPVRLDAGAARQIQGDLALRQLQPQARAGRSRRLSVPQQMADLPIGVKERCAEPGLLRCQPEQIEDRREDVEVGREARRRRGEPRVAQEQGDAELLMTDRAAVREVAALAERLPVIRADDQERFARGLLRAEAAQAAKSSPKIQSLSSMPLKNRPRSLCRS